MKEITYSFIIPHKNCPIFLNRCLDSIPMREDVQIIVVDDNSDLDKKPTITRKDVEVILLDDEHAKGAGRARNVGLSRAKGKWLLFADADDCYTDYLNTLLDKYAEDDVTDIVYLNAYMFDDNNNIKPLTIEKRMNDYLKGKRKSEFALRFIDCMPWCRMLKREVVVNNKLSFEEISAWNDVAFGLYASLYSKNFTIEKPYVYKYYQWSQGSITEKNKMMMVDEYLILRGKFITFHKQIGYHSHFHFLGIIERLVRAGKISIKDSVNYYRRYLHEYHVCWVKDCAYYLYELLFHRIVRKIVN